MGDLPSWVPWSIGVALTLLTIGGGAWLIPRLYTQALGNLQDRVIAALRQENQTLTERVAELTNVVLGLQATIATLRVMLRRRGLRVRINGESVTIIDTGPVSETTLRIKKEAIIESVNDDEEDIERTKGESVTK